MQRRCILLNHMPSLVFGFSYRPESAMGATGERILESFILDWGWLSFALGGNQSAGTR